MYDRDHSISGGGFAARPLGVQLGAIRRCLFHLRCARSGKRAILPLLNWALPKIEQSLHLKPFDHDETAGYAKHHLLIAGCQSAIFSDGFLAGVYDHTKGVARKINNLCRGALLLGTTEGKQILDETDLKRVILDLEGQVG